VSARDNYPNLLEEPWQQWSAMCDEIDRLRDFTDRAVNELAKHGWGDFHYGPQPQKAEIVALVEEHSRLPHIRFSAPPAPPCDTPQLS
jgi:hypothetical protein